MKIMFFIRSLAKGGAETQLSLTAAGLKSMAVNVVVVTYYDEYNDHGNNLNYKRLLNSGVQIVSLNKRGRYDLLGFCWRFMRIIKHHKPDVIYSYLELSNIFACLAKLVNKHIKLVWGKRSSDLQLSKYSLSLRFEHKLEQVLSYIPDLIIVNSECGKNYLKSKNYKAKASVVHNGIDTEFYQRVLGDKASLVKLLNLTGDEVLIGSVGRIDPAKDYELLIRSAQKVVKENQKVRFIVVGRVINQDYYLSLLKLITEFDLGTKIFFIPEFDNVNLFFSSIDVFLSTSYSEGFSNVIAEAMSCSTPCIVTDAGDNRILVGDSGVVVERSNPDLLASRMLKLINDPSQLQAYADKARKQILDNFTINKLITRTAYQLSNLR